MPKLTIFINKMIENVEIYLENTCWYVRYTENGIPKISNAFMEESHAIRYVSIIQAESEQP